MWKQIKRWFIRIFAVVIVFFMMFGLISNFITAQQQKSQQEEEKAKTADTYVDGKNTHQLEKIGQEVLIPKSMKLESTSTDEETGSIVYQYSSIQYDEFAVGMGISEMTDESGANMDENLFTLEEAIEALRYEEVESAQYFTFKGETNDFMIMMQKEVTDNESYSYEVDYIFFNVETRSRYTISLFLLNDDTPTKTDMLKVDRLGKEMLANTKYISMETVDQYSLPEGNEDVFNHVLK